MSERLIFQNLTYNREMPCCNDRPIPVFLIMTSNASETGYTDMLENCRNIFDRFVGETEVLVYGDTLQLKDYDSTDWKRSMFDPEAKRLRHENVFPEKCRKAFESGMNLVNKRNER